MSPTGGSADGGELDLSGIDDQEIELVRPRRRSRLLLRPRRHGNALLSSACLQYLLSDHEVKVKTALWMAENSDYLKEQKGASAPPPPPLGFGFSLFHSFCLQKKKRKSLRRRSWASTKRRR